MAEQLRDSSNLESTTVWINRTSTTVKGGRRLGFASLVVVGDRQGSVGIGYGKAPGVPAAIEKAQKDARKKLFKINTKASTIPHPVTGRFCASKVRLIPAGPGTGVIAGGTVRAVLEMAGITDCLTKSYGSNNKINCCKAVMDGLQQLRTRDLVAELRGVEIESTTVDEALEMSKRFMKESAAASGEKAKAPVNVVGQDQRGGGRRGGGGRGRSGGGRGRGGAPQAPDQSQPAEGGAESTPASSDGNESQS